MRMCASLASLLFCQLQPVMATKQKKKRQLSSKNEDNSGAIPWPDLPQQLTHLVGKQLQLLANISWGGVSKSWRTAPRQCSSVAKAPWLELSKANENSVMNLNSQCHNKPLSHVLTIPQHPGFYIWRGRKGRPEPWKRFVGCSHGLIVTVADEIHNLSLFEPHWTHWFVPSWDTKIPFKFATLCSSPRRSLHDSRVMVVTGISNPAFMIYRLGRCGENQSWIEHDCATVDPYASEGSVNTISFTNAIGLKGKFYALSSQGALALIEEVDSEFKITGLSKNRAVPSVSARHFVEYLMESNGEILLAFLISRQSMNMVDDVEVFRLDLSRLIWVKIESLGNRTLFIGTNCCMSVTASQVGCKSNHVYFTHQALDSWKEYDMANDSISPCHNSNGFQIKSPTWDQPIPVDDLLNP